MKTRSIILIMINILIFGCKKKDIVATNITLSTEVISLNVNSEDTVKAVATPSNANITWSSSNESVATINSAGIVKGINNGFSIIRGTATGGIEAKCTVYVAKYSAFKGAGFDSVLVNKRSPIVFTSNSNMLIFSMGVSFP